MSDLIMTAVLAAVMLYMGIFVTKATFLRLAWLWFAGALVFLEIADWHGGHVSWLVKGVIVAVALFLGIASYARDECGQRTRYSIAWSVMRADIARRFGRS